MTTCPCQNPRVPPPALGPDPERPRLSRLIRRLFWPAAAALVVLAAILTAASFAYNLATNGLVTRPSGLRMIRAGAFDTRYLQWGTSGSPVVLVPGAFEPADTFAALGPELGTHHRVFAIDLTGTGYSSPGPPFDARHLAMQVLAFIRAMHLTGANAPVLVGHSSGAAVAGMTVLLDSHAAAGVVFLDGDATALTFPPIVGWADGSRRANMAPPAPAAGFPQGGGIQPAARNPEYERRPAAQATGHHGAQAGDLRPG